VLQVPPEYVPPRHEHAVDSHAAAWVRAVAYSGAAAHAAGVIGVEGALVKLEHTPLEAAPNVEHS